MTCLFHCYSFRIVIQIMGGRRSGNCEIDVGISSRSSGCCHGSVQQWWHDFAREPGSQWCSWLSWWPLFAIPSSWLLAFSVQEFSSTIAPVYSVEFLFGVAPNPVYNIWKRRWLRWLALPFEADCIFRRRSGYVKVKTDLLIAVLWCKIHGLSFSSGHFMRRVSVSV